MSALLVAYLVVLACFTFTIVGIAIASASNGLEPPWIRGALYAILVLHIAVVLTMPKSIGNHPVALVFMSLAAIVGWSYGGACLVMNRHEPGT